MKDHCGRQWSGFDSAMVAGSSEKEATAVLLEGKRENEGTKNEKKKNIALKTSVQAYVTAHYK